VLSTIIHIAKPISVNSYPDYSLCKAQVQNLNYSGTNVDALLKILKYE
jgi:hypothetical protein